MRYRTAAILSIVVIAVMVGLPFALKAVLEPYVESGLEIPNYTRAFLDTGFLLWRYRWLLTPAIVVVLFLIAEFTSESRVGK